MADEIMSTRSHFGALLVQVAQAVARMEREEVCCGDLTFQQFRTLRVLERIPRVTLRVLATRLAIDQSTASRNLGRLMRGGYLSKDPNESDHRSALLRLTPKGRTAISTMACDERDAIAAIYDRVPPIRRPSVVETLSALSDALESRAAPIPTKPKKGRS